MIKLNPFAGHINFIRLEGITKYQLTLFMKTKKSMTILIFTIQSEEKYKKKRNQRKWDLHCSGDDCKQNIDNCSSAISLMNNKKATKPYGQAAITKEDKEKGSHAEPFNSAFSCSGFASLSYLSLIEHYGSVLAIERGYLLG